MNFSKTISIPIIFLLLFVTIMAVSGIRGFLRLVPSIEQINTRNTQTIYLTEKMMSALAVEENIEIFEDALALAKKNLTEPGEELKINDIETNYKAAFSGNLEIKEQVVKDIAGLSEINRLAMQDASLNAKKLSSVGAWVIAFMGIFIWILGLIILNTLNKTIILPLAELKDVLQSYHSGNHLRRCPKIAPGKDFQQIYDGLNSLLDKGSFK